MTTPTRTVRAGNGISPGSHQLQNYEGELTPNIVFDRECQYLRDLQTIAQAINDGLSGIPFGTASYNFTLKTYHMILQDVQKQQDRVEASSRRLIQHLQEQQHQDRWNKLQSNLFNQLMEQYGDLGPQYQILIRRLSIAETHAQQMEEAGRVESGEWRKITQDIRETISALQKYTESEKKEIVNKEIQDAVLAVLEIVESELSNRYPVIWQRIVHQVESRVQEETDGE